MIKTLTPVGDDLAIVIDRSMLDMLTIDRDTPLEVTTDGRRILIGPVGADRQEDFVESARRMMAIHPETFRKLAQ